MPRVALVTATAALGTDVDLEPLLDALGRAGIEADVPCWDNRDVAWASYDLAVLRSPWDYVERYEEFLGWIEATENHVRVLNRSSVVRWNTDKHYLADLAQRGLPVVPTEFFRPGEARPRLAGHTGDLVVKPVISAGSRDTMWHSDPGTAETHAGELLAAGRAVMVQPFLDGITTYGETGLVYFDGAFSHAFRKAPILTLDAPPTDEFFAHEEITARVPSDAERQLADAAIASCDADLLYGRVDLVPGPDGQPLVMELELAEPSYFVGHAPGSADRFAAAVAKRL
jgi:O-ureido-D-serine cyclo-ligase